MSDDHTPAPWRLSVRGITVVAGPDDADGGYPSGRPVATTAPDHGLAARSANARRICACVNACAGLTTAALESGVVADLLMAAQALLADVDRYLARGGKLTDGEAHHVRLMRDAVGRARGS